MPIPKNISPLLDNILTGDAISDHNGIQCFPAMHQLTDEKYILKVISVPASQTQLEAMLLTGALASKEDAQKYYEQRANELAQEIQVLQQLSRQEGFLPYTGYQIKEKEDATGYDIYILTPYKRSLERQFAKKSMTQLDGLNLGLDICSALTACRRSGYLFVNLKPSNIFIGDNGEYRISDFGFVSLATLKYATLPEHYISSYTAPEITDVFSTITETADVYAIGMILYSVFNGGVLPELSHTLPAPAYADDALSQIIMKACSTNPEDRWQDPAQMGQMLVGYIQKFGAFDTPIVPPDPEPESETAHESEAEAESETVAETVPETQAGDETEEVAGTFNGDTDVIPVIIPTEETIAETEAEAVAEVEEIEPETSEISEEEPKENFETVEQLSIEEMIRIIEADDAKPETLDSSSYPSEEMTMEAPIVFEDIPSENDAEAEEAPDVAPDNKLNLEDTLVPGLDPTEVTAALQDEEQSNDHPNDNEHSEIISQQEEPAYEGITDEVSQILTQADSLAEHDVPEPVIVPENVEINMDDIDSDALEETPPESLEEETTMKNDEYFDDSYFNDENQQKPRSHWLRNTIIISILLLLLAGGFAFYKFYVLKTVTSFEISGSGSSLTVMVTSDADESLLTVSCADPSRKVITVPVVNGKAEFTGLDPSTEYTITAGISGMHILKGTTQGKYATPAGTSIVEYSVETGATVGTVNIKFAVNGPDSERWSFTYQADGIEPQTESFVGHSFTLKGLVENTIYTGVLKPEKDLMIAESLEITFTASALIRAEDLKVIGCSNGSLTAQWQAPEAVTVESWNIRCYNENYDETQNIKGTTATFHNLNSAEAFTVEVWAKGQTIKQTVKVAANSITVRDLSADLANPGKVVLSWKTTEIPQGGWKVSYFVNDSEKTFTCNASNNKVTIAPVAPGGKYTFTVSAADPAVSTFCDSFSCVIPESAGDFTLSVLSREITANDLNVTMCKRPSANWSKNDLTDSSYTQNFKSGENAGFLIFLDAKFEASEETIEAVIVITDEDGGLYGVSSASLVWKNMWNQNYCALNVPSTPKEAGCYTATLYFNNMLLDEFEFAIS